MPQSVRGALTALLFIFREEEENENTTSWSADLACCLAVVVPQLRRLESVAASAAV